MLPPTADTAMADPAADPMAADPAMDAAAEPSDGSYRIMIDVYPDGSFEVGKDGGEDPKPADSIKAALTHALEIYRADGNASAEAQFDAGFSGKEA